MARLGLQSSHFDSGGTLPRECTCEGSNRSPNLRWYGAPSGVESYVLVCDDPDAAEAPFTHWLVYDIPPETLELPPGRPRGEELDEGGVQGMNSFGDLGYGGPCPPPGDPPHRYVFRLYALDTVLGMAPGADRNALMKAMHDHVLEETELIGTYGREPVSTR